MAEYCLGCPIVEIFSNNTHVVLNDVIDYENDGDTMKFMTLRYHGDDLQDVLANGTVIVRFDLYDGTSVDANKVDGCTQTWQFDSIEAWIATASKINDINPFCIKLAIG